MGGDDFRTIIGRQDFLASLDDKAVEEIEFLLESGKIADTEKRALAKGIIQERQRSSELAKCQRKLRNTNIALAIAAIAACAAVASAVAPWAKMLSNTP